MYACLELRIALEKIAYEKLKVRLKKIAPEEIDVWQPNQVLKVLRELTDDKIEESYTISVASETGGTAQQFMAIGSNKGVSIPKLTKYWHKLGSNLHADMPQRNEEESTERQEKLEEFLREVIDYVKTISDSTIEAHFSMDVTFDCMKCEKIITRNKDLLNDKQIVQCQNPNCIESYITHINDSVYTFERNGIDMKCEKCGYEILISANALLETPYSPYIPGKDLECPECGCKHELNWQIIYKKLANC